MSATTTPQVLAAIEDEPVAWLTYVGTAQDAIDAWRGFLGEPGEDYVAELVGLRPWDPEEDCDEDAPHDDPDVCGCASRLQDGWQMQTSVDDPRAVKAWRVEWQG